MKVLVLGAGGQLGRAIVSLAPPQSHVVAIARKELDVSDPVAVSRRIAAEVPDLVLNAAAYTAVDRAEAEPEVAHLANAVGPAVLARECAARGVRLVHVSTDFVFDGASGRPYAPNALVCPLSVYGRSKAEGERAVLEAAPSALVVRTSWVYAASGRNFMVTMLRLMHAGGPIRVVADQVGAPTHADGLAAALWRLSSTSASGIHHWHDAGVASWYDFAVAIAEEATAAGLLREQATVVPITTAQFPTPAKRPPFSVLDATATWDVIGTPPHWRRALRRTLAQLLETAA